MDISGHLKHVACAQDAPLLKQLLTGGGQEQSVERLWLLRLLAAGFRGAADGDIFR